MSTTQSKAAPAAAFKTLQKHFVQDFVFCRVLCPSLNLLICGFVYRPTAGIECLDQPRLAFGATFISEWAFVVVIDSPGILEHSCPVPKPVPGITNEYIGSSFTLYQK